MCYPWDPFYGYYPPPHIDAGTEQSVLWLDNGVDDWDNRSSMPEKDKSFVFLHEAHPTSYSTSTVASDH